MIPLGPAAVSLHVRQQFSIPSISFLVYLSSPFCVARYRSSFINRIYGCPIYRLIVISSCTVYNSKARYFLPHRYIKKHFPFTQVVFVYHVRFNCPRSRFPIHTGSFLTMSALSGLQQISRCQWQFSNWEKVSGSLLNQAYSQFLLSLLSTVDLLVLSLSWFRTRHMIPYTSDSILSRHAWHHYWCGFPQIRDRNCFYHHLLWLFQRTTTNK